MELLNIILGGLLANVASVSSFYFGNSHKAGRLMNVTATEPTQIAWRSVATSKIEKLVGSDEKAKAHGNRRH